MNELNSESLKALYRCVKEFDEKEYVVNGHKVVSFATTLQTICITDDAAYTATYHTKPGDNSKFRVTVYEDSHNGDHVEYIFEINTLDLYRIQGQYNWHWVAGVMLEGFLGFASKAEARNERK